MALAVHVVACLKADIRPFRSPLSLSLCQSAQEPPSKEQTESAGVQLASTRVAAWKQPHSPSPGGARHAHVFHTSAVRPLMS